jgi:hypothetical protein
MQFKAQARLETKTYKVYVAGTNERGNEEMRQLQNFYYWVYQNI